jgi:hypothetical protein
MATQPTHAVSENGFFWTDELRVKATRKSYAEPPDLKVIEAMVRRTIDAYERWSKAEREIFDQYKEQPVGNSVLIQTTLAQLSWIPLPYICARESVTDALHLLTDAVGHSHGAWESAHYARVSIDTVARRYAQLTTADQASVNSLVTTVATTPDLQAFFADCIPYSHFSADVAASLCGSHYLTTRYLTDSAQLASVNPVDGIFDEYDGLAPIVLELIDRFGDRCDELLARSVGAPLYGEHTPFAVELCARMDSDLTIRALIDHLDLRPVQLGFELACQLQPARVIRLLGTYSGPQTTVAELRLRTMAIQYPTVFAEHQSLFSAALVERILHPRASVVVAQRADLPEILASPPWEQTKTKRTSSAALAVLAQPVLAQPVPPEFRWNHGQLETALAMSGYDKYSQRDVHLQQIESIEHWMASGKYLQHQADGQRQLEELKANLQPLIEDFDAEASAWIRSGSVDFHALWRCPSHRLQEVLPYVNVAMPDQSDHWATWRYGPSILKALSAHGITLVEQPVRKLIETTFAAFSDLTPQIGATWIAPLYATQFVTKTGRRVAAPWFRRFPRHGVAGLIPTAVGPSGKPQKDSATVLRWMNSIGLGETIQTVASTCSPDVTAAVTALLNYDTSLDFPSRRPALPTWLVPDMLPSLQLNNQLRALPTDSIATLLTMLCFSPLNDPYVGIPITVAACTQKSLDEFAWSLFQQWLLAGYPPKEGWAFRAIALIGGQDCAHQLIPLIERWPSEGAAARAKTGLGILAAMGTETSLMLLHGLSLKAKSTALRKEAKQLLNEAAEAAGLTPEDLADRLVPTLDLDANGTTQLDFGPRQFTVGFDETLAPFVKDATGAVLRALPKPNAKDDAELAENATTRWKRLKKAANASGKVQIRRLESAMCSQRSWTVASFDLVFVQHPLMVNVARRLVWAEVSEAESGEASTRYFRIAEDRSLADEMDTQIELADNAEVRVAHPTTMPAESRQIWASLFGDYELIQPIEQLGRQTYAPPTQLDLADPRLPSNMIKGRKVFFGKIFALEHRGWLKGEVVSHGELYSMEKDLGTRGTLTLLLAEGIYPTGGSSTGPEVALDSLSIGSIGANQFVESRLNAIEYSELMRDISFLLT